LGRKKWRNSNLTNPNKEDTTMATLEEKAILVKPTIGVWEGRIKFHEAEMEFDQKHGSKNATSIRKVLFDCSEFKRMDQVANKMRRKVHDVLTLPWGKDGTGILPIESHEKYMKQARECKDEFEEAYRAFEKIFDNQVNVVEKARLNSSWRREDYPTKQELRKKFYFEIYFSPIPSSADFRLNAQHDDIKEIVASLEEKRDERLKEALRDPYERLYEAIKHLHKRLSEADKGFKTAMVGNIAELVQILPSLNLTGDERLTELTKLAEEELASLDTKDLSASKELREVTMELTEEMMKEMESLL